MEETELIVFKPRDGINCNSLNQNFAKIQGEVNSNELQLTTIGATALKKDGSNIEQPAINKFQQTETTELEWAGTINLADNSTNFLNPSGNTTVVLPNVPSDVYSHTIILIVQGSQYSVASKTESGAVVTKHLYNGLKIDTTQTYSLMYIFNKLDSSWYYSLTQ